MSRTRATCVAVLLPLALPAGAAGPPPERIGAWTLRPDPPQPGAGCSMTSGGALGRLLFMLAGDELRLEATANRWSTSGALDYPTHLTVDADPPADIAARGAGPDGLHLLPDTRVPTAAFVERLRTGRSLAVRKEGDPGAETVAFDITGFGPAYARLEACAAGAEERARAAASARRERCDKLADAAAAATRGTRAAPTEDQIAIDTPVGQVVVFCTAYEAPSLDLSRDGRGIPPAMLVAAGKLAGALAGRPAAALSGLPAACLARVQRYTLRRGGKRTHFPEGTTAMFEGEAKAPPIKLSCRYYDSAKIQPSFSIETE